MRKVDIVYLYEHAARELDVACAVSAILQRQYGVTVEIVQWPIGFLNTFHNLQPRLVVLPFCYTEQSFRKLLAAWRKSIFFNVTWEQLFYPGNKTAKTPRGEFSVNHVIHHAWSEFYASFLKQQGIPENHIYLNGQPAYQLYDEPYRNYFASRTYLAERFGLNPECRWLFFPENYNWAFYTQKTIDQFIRNGQSPDDVHAMQEYCKKSLAETVLWCAEIARTNKVEVILRPRPATSLTEFKEAVAQIIPSIPAGLHILKDESVRDWILASDVVVSSYSTSLLEAAIAGKPVYLVEPYPIPSSLKMQWHEYLPHIKTPQQFMESCLENTEQRAGGILGEWAREQMMNSGDAIGRLAEILSHLLSSEAHVPSVPSWRASIPDVERRRRALKWVLSQRLRAIFGRQRVTRVSAEHVNDYFERDVIKTRIQRWSDVLFNGPSNEAGSAQ
jgi:surface carbohydrate biosynthesis protein